jgi:hypothetical protein
MRASWFGAVALMLLVACGEGGPHHYVEDGGPTPREPFSTIAADGIWQTLMGYTDKSAAVRDGRLER